MPHVDQFSADSANLFVVYTTTNSNSAQSAKVCSPVKASIDVCLVRAPRGLRVTRVPPDVTLTEFLDSLAIAAAPHKPVWLPQFVLFVDAPHSKVMFWEFHSSTANPNQCLEETPPPFSSWRHWLKENGRLVGCYSCFPPISVFLHTNGHLFLEMRPIATC